MDKIALFQKADSYKNKIDEVRPIGLKNIKELDEYFKIGLTYSSNALEGNALTLPETKILLEDGITIGGKSIKEHLEVIGHSNAYDYMLKVARQAKVEITEDIILKLHSLFYQGIDQSNAGKYRKNQVYITGTKYIPPKAENVGLKMKTFVLEANEMREKVHPIEYATLLHKRIVDIHPFIDGNGRTARLIMNLVLFNAGYGIVCIPPMLKFKYIESLNLARKKNNEEYFIKFIAECVIETEKDYCRLLGISMHK